MDEPALRQLLADVAVGACPPDEAVRRLRRLPYADLGFARVDHHRALRQGMAEAVYGPGKTAEQCAAIVVELLAEDGAPVLLTRADPDQVKAAVAAAVGAGHGEGTVTGHGGLATAAWRPAAPRAGYVVVVTAGTADLPVAGECRAVLDALGLGPDLLADCGVAGLHRLLASADRLATADAVVVVAGMEGALASVVGGLTPAPVVAVPTSVGYGAALAGVTALLAMLASCASGITVVGIDNGFGAACAVARLLR
ncbi:MAG TPA: nickel pincer cofactor biosynthesis protein LarB [Acidimicrobiales bacterium]|nr:nickel pincer cofactor biosynthesis protein LarB [Acidimicrobiales bacterium]